VAVVGVYYFSPDIFQCIRDTPLGQTDDQFERAYQLLIDRGQAVHIEYEGLFESYKFPWNLLTLNDLLLKQRIKGQQISPSAKISDLAVIGDNVIIEDNVRVFEHAVIRGPAYIGAGSVIGNGSMVWGGCSFGPGCVIGFGSEIKHSIFGRNVWTHRNYVGDSIISDNCSFGAGTITANFRFDEGDVQVKVGEQRLSTGMNKFGVIMAEGCRTGCNSVLGPGVKIGPNSIVGPGVTLLEDLSPNKIALPTRASYEIRDNRLDLTKKSRDEQMKKLDKA
jgi:bifunctional UDP-N-acetylglucosamine pyrophosphorylase/glucosamine-1-phosphate N-acetyltransferase